MQLIQLNEHTWVIQGGANIGVIAYEGRCLIIDSGMDKDAGRDILKPGQKIEPHTDGAARDPRARRSLWRSTLSCTTDGTEGLRHTRRSGCYVRTHSGAVVPLQRRSAATRAAT